MRNSTHDKRAAARKRSLEQIVELTPLEYMLKVMNKNSASRKRRLAMARAAPPYCHTKLKPSRSGNTRLSGLVFGELN